MIATSCDADETSESLAGDRLRNLFYHKYSSTGVAQVKDGVENRTISNKPSSAKTHSGSGFQDNREFSGSFYYNDPNLIKHHGEEELFHNGIEFEVQVFGLKNLFIMNLSKYSADSHSEVYTPKREFDNLFTYLFPPILYGEEFLNYYLQGFNPSES